jgi:hypothetical protein
VPAHIAPEISSSPRGLRVRRRSERLEADASDSASATTPRITGRAARWRAPETSGRLPICDGDLAVRRGRRTATAHVETPRIITPSSTAWPPTAASRWRSGASGLLHSVVGSRRDWSGYRAALGRRRWKRSTRPPVSTSFCLPV